MKLSFLIINYNGGRYVTSCLDSIRNYASAIDHEVVVVDNNSSDGSDEIIRANYPDIKYVRNSRNVGFSRAMNQAYRASSGEYLFSFNPDAELTDGCIDRVIAYMDSHPQVGKIGTATIEDDKILLPATEFPRWNSVQTLKALRSRLPSSINTAKDAGGTVDWLFGTGILVRRSSISSNVEIYEENSFLFWEEYWLSKRIRANGYQIVVLPDARIIHHSGVTFKKSREKLKVARSLSLAHEYLIRKAHYGVLNARLNALLLFIDYTLLYVLFLPKRLLQRGNVDMYNTINDYYAKARGALTILFKSAKQVRLLDRHAEEFFNR